MTSSYRGTLDLWRFPADVRKRIANDAVPSLLNFLGAAGIRVECGWDLRVIREVQALDPRKPRLFELANPDLQDNIGPDNTFVLKLIRNEDGAPVACAACRLRWVEGSLDQALSSQRLIFDKPEERSAGRFLVSCEPARRVTDTFVGVTTGLTVLPNNRGVFKATIRLLHLWVLANWEWGYLTAICSDDFAKKYPLDVEGYSGIHPGVRWQRDGIWSPYRIVLAEREHWRRIVSSPHFGDLRVPLGAPQEAIEVGAL